LLDRIDQLRALADATGPIDGDRVNTLLADVRVYFAAVGATHCPRAPQAGVSAGTMEQARDVYR
jgi:Flp pilus assembly CpaF family ATPase